MPSLAVLGMTLKGSTHDPGPWRLYEGLQGKPFFIEPYIFCHDSYEWKIDIELGGGGSCQSWGDESGFTLWTRFKAGKKRALK